MMMKRNRVIAGILFSGLLLVSYLSLFLSLDSSRVLAEGENKCTFGEQWNSKTGLPIECKPENVVEASKDVKQYIKNVIDILFPVLGMLAVYFIVVNGFNMVVYSSNETKAQEAQKGITWAILGLVGIILAYAIISAFINFIYGAFVS